jgi:hypothetical protein
MKKPHVYALSINAYQILYIFEAVGRKQSVHALITRFALPPKVTFTQLRLSALAVLDYERIKHFVFIELVDRLYTNWTQDNVAILKRCLSNHYHKTLR